MGRFVTVAAGAVLLVSRVAFAATIPAEYVVETTPLTKKAVATDTVTASLYSDPACTALVATTGAIALQDVELTERLRPFNARKTTLASKQPYVVRLHFTFSATPPPGDLYVAVTSSVPPAIVGYPESCQRQEPVSDAVAQICKELTGTSTCDLATTIKNLAHAPNVVFSVTNTGPGGSFGNRAATSATCAAAATSQGLTCSSTVALIAYSGGDDIANLPTNHSVPSGVPVVAAGTLNKIADNWSDFLDGSWDTCLGGICDPSGPAPGGLAGQFYLTGANNDGTVDASNNCSNWSSTTGTFAETGDTCYGQSSPPFCSSGSTFHAGLCANSLCCGVTQGAMLCLCY